jgi:colanic acid/amylovoran biosynthesis glycosyltransferase
VPKLVCVGRLCEDKGQLLLVEAVKQLMQQGCRVQLVLVGDGELRPEIEARIAQAGLAEQITITGWASSETVRQHLLAARAMVLPSFAEGLPVVIMEALALGRPVISTTIAGIPELVQPDCGWLVPPSSVEALVAAIQTAVYMPVQELQEMGKIGALRVAQQHNASLEGQQLATLFRTYATPTEYSSTDDDPSLSAASWPTATHS